MRILLVAVLLVTLPTFSLLAQAGVPTPMGFTALFNGENLSGWHGMKHVDPRQLAAMTPAQREALHQASRQAVEQHWRVENGELVNDGQGDYLTSNRSFGDIELLIEYKTVAKADSGIYLRATPQVQIWDYTKEGGKWDRGADKGSGGLYNNSRGQPGQTPLVLADKPFGEWNQFRIVQVGSRTSVWLNDKLVVDHAIMENFFDRKEEDPSQRRPLFRSGPVQLQTHGGEIRWRNIFVREIDSREANRWLASKDAYGFESIFNGQDLTGWSGVTENYEVRDGSIVCKPQHGGVLFTEQEYGDFIARLEFRLPPGGNNGLAIRYPGEGNAAYDGMTELQILDTQHEKYADRLDPRQYHGSAYGMVSAHPGYLRPNGQWNWQEVTVKGSTIKVELNGYVILDTDLSQVTTFMKDRPHPGKDLKRGHFGFAGHNDPVQFRHLLVKRLDVPTPDQIVRGQEGQSVAEPPAREPSVEQNTAQLRRRFVVRRPALPFRLQRRILGSQRR